jgi:hypothetical protein
MLTPFEIVSKALYVDKATAQVISGGLFLLAVAALVITWQINPDDLYRVGIFIVVFSIFALVLAHLPGIMSRLLAWFVVLTSISYGALFAFQFVSNSYFTPPVMRAGCFLSPWEQNCPLNELQSVSSAVEPSPAIPGDSDGAPLPSTAATDSGSPGAVDTLTEGRQVWIHFAGDLSRERVIELAAALGDAGWTVVDAGRGGERISSAYGLNQVRYVDPDDLGAAQQLARRISASGLVGTVDVRDFTHLANRGLLEVWISVR